MFELWIRKTRFSDLGLLHTHGFWLNNNWVSWDDDFKSDAFTWTDYGLWYVVWLIILF